MSPVSAMLAARPTTVYRLYDKSESLLYVGMTVDPESRFRQHRNWHVDWWPEVDSVLFEDHPNRAEAAFAEKVAMILERPRKNVVGNHARAQSYASGGWLYWVLQQEEQELCVADADVPRYRCLRMLAREKWLEACQLDDAGLIDARDAARSWVGFFAALAEDMGYMDDDIFADLVTGQ
ncbi:GIY-YIG nuclease family protein [Arthrobacter sp. NPDC058130]|uniref:GIY-YIG nuclease family protein n=1 Tax=Arthrobacter sp. NPDC058130 TaxID=3346353 RepID=UPI0036E8069E